MIQEPPIDTQAHIAAIDSAIAALISLHGRTASPAPISHQFIGTIVDNTVVLLTAPGNSLDNGSRSFKFTHTRNWLSLMQAVHRSFFSSLHTATERALAEICVNRGIAVTNRMQAQTDRKFASIEAEVVHLPTVQSALKKLRAKVRTGKPGFEDYLESALTVGRLPKVAKQKWRGYFKAISIVRNKVSHSDATLSEGECERLRKGGLSPMISTPGVLVMNAHMYDQIIRITLEFFDALHEAEKSLPGNAS